MPKEFCLKRLTIILLRGPISLRCVDRSIVMDATRDQIGRTFGGVIVRLESTKCDHTKDEMPRNKVKCEVATIGMVSYGVSKCESRHAWTRSIL